MCVCVCGGGGGGGAHARVRTGALSYMCPIEYMSVRVNVNARIAWLDRSVWL